MKSHVVQQALPVFTAIKIPLQSIISFYQKASSNLRISGAKNAQNSTLHTIRPPPDRRL